MLFGINWKEMEGACSTHGRGQMCVQGLGGENLMKVYCLEEEGVDRRIIFN
jgi:hypothetical protein